MCFNVTHELHHLPDRHKRDVTSYLLSDLIDNIPSIRFLMCKLILRRVPAHRKQAKSICIYCYNIVVPFE
jgi:hypothetical protein